ncbi:M48 family metalloprotease [Desulfosarcina cetonica]
MKTKHFFVILLFLCNIEGCSIIQFWESSGYDPISNAYISFPCFTNKETADVYCNKVIAKIGDTEILPDNEIQVKADRLLRKVSSAYFKLIRSSSVFSSYRDYGLYYIPNLKIKIFSTQMPLAASYPNGEIHFSRALWDSDRPYSAKNDKQRIALISHELIHILHGHICYQWKVADAYNQFIKDKYLYDLTKLTQYLPDIIYLHNL